MSEEDVRFVMRVPWVSIASDGSGLNLKVPGKPHPRSFGTNVRVLGKYVREEKVSHTRRRREKNDFTSGADAETERSRTAEGRLLGGCRRLRSQHGVRSGHL